LRAENITGWRELRFDFADSLDRPRILPDGSAIVHGRAARTGDHEYRWGTERRDLDELESIVRQLPGKPVTVDHPHTMLSKGGKASVVGAVKRASVRNDRGDRQTGDNLEFVHAEVELRVSSFGLSVMRAGRRELSLGYETSPVNGRQTETRVDHLALVHAGRCGATCSIRTDCAGDECGCAIPEPAIEVQAFRYLTAFAAGA
jgi:hypothetical protein